MWCALVAVHMACFISCIMTDAHKINMTLRGYACITIGMNNIDYKLALLGHPVAHSQSPALHNGWLRAHGLGGSYSAIDCAPEALADTAARLRHEGYRGFNVTVPHKQAIMAQCDHVDALARVVGAVNTVTIQDDGQLYGTNTDVFGFMDNMRRQMAHDQITGGSFDFTDFTEKTVVIIGAGGAARAALHGVLQANVSRVVIINRTRSNAENLRAGCLDPARVDVTPWEARADALLSAALLVNTTSLGMAGMPALDLALEGLAQEAAVYDIVYKPLMTDLLTRAAARGHGVITGDGMLVAQARLSFEQWTGIAP